ncbi:MAG: type II toxin-antitoxin system prevent-host-death family antitoxin [Muribaculaceae bacterium]|nr:type II toxin-antitoxin system prevent-host-death family antitoxin [Muribaculaceae bacterium]
MNVISAREFRANQGKFLNAARNGDSLLLTSRYGVFKIVPVTEEDTLTTRICKGLEEVKQIREGKIKGLTLEDVLNEL